MFNDLDSRLWAHPTLTNIGDSDYVIVTNRNQGDLSPDAVAPTYISERQPRTTADMGPAGRRMVPPGLEGTELDELYCISAALLALVKRYPVDNNYEGVISGLAICRDPHSHARVARLVRGGITRPVVDITVAEWKGGTRRGIAHYVDPGLEAYEPGWLFSGGDAAVKKMRDTLILDTIVKRAPMIMRHRQLRRRIATGLKATAAGFTIYSPEEDRIRYLSARELRKHTNVSMWEIHKSGYIHLVGALRPGEMPLSMADPETIDRMIRTYPEDLL